MELIYKCPKCGETENLHFNYDYSKQHRPVDDVLCNECGEIFTDKVSKWDLIYEEYSNDQYPPFGGPFTNALLCNECGEIFDGDIDLKTKR